jgi:ribosomal protein S18 acetylase RimI-like enzyme
MAGGSGPRSVSRSASRPRSKVEVAIREAAAADLPGCARLGAALSRFHHRLDPARFFTVPDLEAGYAWWLGKERRNPRAVVLAAVRRRGAKEAVVGYAYGRLEPRDWNSLREACGLGIDVIVEPRHRGAGLGTRLVEALGAALAARGAPSMVIEVAARNPRARRAFAGMGFRPTMLEMVRELTAVPKARRRARART